jgi:PIN domain nuclease of toxin-antitoxin system
VLLATWSLCEQPHRGRARMALRVDPVQVAHQVGVRIARLMGAKSRQAFTPCRVIETRALSRLGTRRVTDLANDYDIQAAVMEVGHNYRQVA